jgi:hypothetical protein
MNSHKKEYRGEWMREEMAKVATKGGQKWIHAKACKLETECLDGRIVNE